MEEVVELTIQSFLSVLHFYEMCLYVLVLGFEKCDYAELNQTIWWVYKWFVLQCSADLITSSRQPGISIGFIDIL